MKINSKNTEKILLERFNKRDSLAFDEIYTKYFTEFHLYATALYKNSSIEAIDAIQDIFLIIWQNKYLQFNTEGQFKAYVIAAIRNNFLTFKGRKDYEVKYCQGVVLDNSIDIDILENSIYYHMENAYSILPKDAAEIIKLYIEGWDYQDIALKLGKSIKTIYNIKSNAISTLKGKLSKDKLFITMFLMSTVHNFV